MPDAFVTITGLDKVASRLEGGWEGVRKAAAQSLYEEGNRIMAAAKLITPVDTGALRNSGFVATPILAGKTITVVLGFGGPAAPYATIVHENLSARHPTGQAKFLETPFRQAAEGFAKRLSARIKGAT